MQSQTFYGNTVVTQDLHNANMGAVDASLYRQFANSWFKRYTLEITAPAGWTFEGNPWMNLVGPGPGVSAQDAQAGFAWNVFPAAHDRFFVIERNASYIKCTCWAGSHSMEVNLACNATHP